MKLIFTQSGTYLIEYKHIHGAEQFADRTLEWVLTPNQWLVERKFANLQSLLDQGAPNEIQVQLPPHPSRAWLMKCFHRLIVKSGFETISKSLPSIEQGDTWVIFYRNVRRERCFNELVRQGIDEVVAELVAHSLPRILVPRPGEKFDVLSLIKDTISYCSRFHGLHSVFVGLYEDLRNQHQEIST